MTAQDFFVQSPPNPSRSASKNTQRFPQLQRCRRGAVRRFNSSSWLLPAARD